MKCYNVTAICNKAEGRILSVQCEDCPAHLGGCKHVIAFLAWLHRQSEDLPSTSVECYWKKAKLSTVGTSLKFIKAKEITSQNTNIEPKNPQSTSASFLSILTNYSENASMDSQILKHFKEPTNLGKLSIQNAQEFIQFYEQNMDASSCEEASLATLDQSDCPLWYELRYACITASKAHEVSHCKTLQGSLTESTHI